MTIERASEIVAQTKRTRSKAALFDHFVEFFQISDLEKIKQFAELCNMEIQTNE